MPAPTDGEQTTYGLEILSTDSGTGVIGGKLYESTAFVSDANQVGSLDLITGYGPLATGIRTVGVQIGYSGSSRVYGSSTSTLNLYVEEGQALRKVLSNLITDESNTDPGKTCASSFTHTSRKLSIGKTTTAGFADLKLEISTTITHQIPKGDDCITKDEKPMRKTVWLNYNGSQYDLPKELRYE